MLDQMRSAAKSWLAKLFLGLLGASFLVWGVPSSFLPQIGGGKLFVSGSSSVRPSDYSFALRDSLLRRGINRLPSAGELRASGLAAEVLLRMQFDLLLDEEARRMKLGADEDAALQLLRRDPLFHNINGAFDRNSFLGFLNQAGFTQAEVIEKLRGQARRNQLLESLTAGLAAPDTFYQATLLYERGTRSIDYVRISPDHIGEIAPPAQEVLAAWFEEHREQFRAPEYRRFTYMQLNAGMLADPQAISDAQLQEYYDANKDRFGVPERREFAQLRFANRELAEDAHARLQAGTSFEDLVREQGQDMEDIKRGPLARSELPSLMGPEIFSLPNLGDVSEVINDLAGPIIIRIDAIEAAKTPPLAEIADRLRSEMALARANDELRQTMRDIEEARFEGASLAELATQYGLKRETLTLDATGAGQRGHADMLPEALPLRDTLLMQVFASQPGIDRDPLLGQGDYVWYQVEDIIPARNLEFDEVRDDSAPDAWIAEETQRRLTEKAEKLKIELESGKPLIQIAEENGLIVERAAALQRVTNTPTNAPFGHELGADVINAVFATSASRPEKSINLVFPQDEKDVAILFQVTGEAEPLSSDPQSLPAAQRELIAARLAQDFIGQFINQAMRDHALEQNPSLLEELLSDNGLLSQR